MILYLVAFVSMWQNSPDLGAATRGMSGASFPRAKSTGAVCGVLCAGKAISIVAGRDVPDDKLLHPKYIPSPRGSSISDLRKLFADFGVHAIVRSGIGVGTIQTLTSPALLHVKSTSNSGAYNHWVLFLGSESGRWIIADLPGSSFSVTSSELSTLWDGTAIVVSNRPISVLSFWFSWFFGELLPRSAFAVVPFAIGWRVLDRWGFDKSIVCTSFGICLIGISISLLPQAVPGGALVDFDKTIAALRLRSSPSTIEETTDLRSFKGVVTIDSRYPSDYSRGHVKRSINVPVYASDAEIRIVLADVDRRERIIVYCQSSNCAFSHSIAKNLMNAGFSNICVYTPGWVGLNE